MTMRNYGKLFFFCVSCILLVAVSACAERQTAWDNIQSGGILRVGLDPTFPPFEFYDGASLQGLDVDLAEAIASHQGVAAEFKHFGFDGLYDALATNQVDVLISALVPDITRTRDFAYSEGYFDSGLVLVSRSNQPFSVVADLTDKTVGVELGATGHVEATVWQRQVPRLSIVTYPGADEALLALATGEADAAVVDNVSFKLYPEADQVGELVASKLTNEPYAVVVRHDDSRLLDEINGSLAALRDSGQLDSILNSWLRG